MFKRFLYIFLFLLAGVATFAQQYPVQGSLAIASPYPANLSDYANSNIQSLALNLTLTDLTMENKRVRLKLFIQTQNATIAQSIDNVSGEPLIMLDGGIPQRFTSTELAHYFRLENLQGINPDGYARSLPEGVYTISFEVYDYFTGNKLSGRIGQTFWIIINDPPLLNTPQDKSKIADFLSPSGGAGGGFSSGGAGGIIFNWTPRSTQVSNTEYEFTLCELWDATGDPYQQFMSAIPKYQTTVSNTTTLIYNQAQPSLISGYSYAWRVRAKAKAGFEDVGLYRNDGYSNLFTFRYGDPCPAPQSLTLEAKTSDQISATWQAPLSTGSGVRYKLAYRKYSIAGQWNWAETETSDLFRTISDLEPATEYELKVGVSCSPPSGELEGVVFTPSQRITTLAAGQLSGIECGKEPVIDITNQKLIESLKVGDVVMANDHPHTLTKVTGSSEGWSGESWSRESLFGGIKLLFNFSNIKVNTDKQLIDGYFESVYDESQSNIINPGEVVNSMINDITTLVDDINALTTKIDDFIGIIDKRNPSTEEINNLNNYINTNKQTILDNLKNTSGEAAMQKADSAFNEIQEGIDCLRNEKTAPTEVEDPDTHGGPHAAETVPAPDCKQRIKNGKKSLDQAKNQAEQKKSEMEINCYCHDDPKEFKITTWFKDAIDKSPCEGMTKILSTLRSCTDTQPLLVSTTDTDKKILIDATQCLQIEKQKITKLRIVWYKDEMLVTEKTSSIEKYQIDFKKTDLKEFQNDDKKDRGLAHHNAKGKIDFMLLIDEPDDTAFKTQREALKKYLGIGDVSSNGNAKIVLTEEIMKLIYPTASNTMRTQVMNAINKYSDKFKLNTIELMAHFLGEIGAETGGLKKLREDYCYSEDGIKKTFGYAKYCDLFVGYESLDETQCRDLNSWGDGKPSKCNPNLKIYLSSLKVKNKYICSRKFFDYVYSCRNGNNSPSTKDGSAYAGIGFIQLTGKSNYNAMTNEWNNDPDNGANPKYFNQQLSEGGNVEELISNIDISIKASLYYWKYSNANNYANSVTDPSIFQVGGLINRGDSKLKPIHYEERKTFTYNAYNTLKSKIKK